MRSFHRLLPKMFAAAMMTSLCLFSPPLHAQHNYELYNDGDILYVSPGEVMTVQGDFHMEGGQLDNQGFIEVQGNLYSDNTFQQAGTGILRLENNDVNVADTQFISGNWAVRGGQAQIGVDDGSFYDLELANTQGIVYLVGNGNVADVRHTVNFNPAGASGSPPTNRIITHDIGSSLPANGSLYSATFGLMDPTPGFSGLISNTVSTNGNVSAVDNAYIQGRFRRAISSSGGQYPFVLGLEPAGPGAQRGMQYVRLDFGANSYDVVEGYFETGSPNLIPGLPVECGFNINYFGGIDHGEWVFNDIASGVGAYEVWIWPQDDNFPGQSTWFITKDDSIRGNIGQCGPSPVGLSRSAFNGFSEFGAAAGTVIFPLTLVSLEAFPRDNQYIEIRWNTQDEENTDRFEVERMQEDDGSTSPSFRYISEREAAGNSSSLRSYSLDDFDVKAGPEYHYRLKMIDRDGSYSYSETVRARLLPDVIRPRLSLYPNPAGAAPLTVDLLWPQSDEVSLQMLDARGKVLHSRPLQLEKGNNSLHLALDQLPAGPYLIRVQGSSLSLTQPFIRLQD